MTGRLHRPFRTRRRTALAAWVAAGVILGPGCAEPQVQLTVEVGDPASPGSGDDRRIRDLGKALRDGLVERLTAQAPAGDVEVPTGSPRTSIDPPKTAPELERAVAQLRRASHVEIEAPARRIAQAGPGAWAAIAAALIAERKAPKGDYRSVLAIIGGDVPNRYGHFALHWKRAHGYDVQLSEDWFEDLLAVRAGFVSASLRPVYRDCVLTAALLRAAASIGDGARADRAAEVVQTLLDTAYIHAGTFRDEVGRAIQTMGDAAVPTLVRVGGYLPKNARDEETPRAKRAAYARYQLDAMDRLHPERAIAAVRGDPRRLVELLDAYGEARTPEAAGALLDLVDDRAPAVRTAARRAFTAYVTGPAPRAVTRSVRLLGGATSRARAFLSYRARAALAVEERLTSQWPEFVEEPCETRREDGTTDTECEARPARHTQVLFERLDHRRQARQITALAKALELPDSAARLDALDTLLAEDPSVGRAPAMVAAFVDGARHAEADGDHGTAARLYRKAAALRDADDPVQARALRTRAVHQEASLPGLSVHGRAMLLRAVDPDARPSVAVADPVPAALVWRFWVSALFGAIGLASIAWIGSTVRSRIWRSGPRFRP